MLKKLHLKRTALLTALILVAFAAFRKISPHSLPKQNLQFFKVNIEEMYNNDEYQLILRNPVNCPNRFFLTCEESSVKMYGHLKQNSSMVEVGEFVTMGQPIALSGQTGQASEEHLHFNVLQADDSKGGLKSYPLDSIGNYKVNKLKRYQSMSN